MSTEWKNILYTPERVERWVRGEISLAELTQVSGAEMLEMAVLGFSLFESGKYEQAKVIFKGLCAIDAGEAYYRTALGAVLLAQGELDPALELFNAAITLDDQELASFVNRGEVHLRRGDLERASEDFARAVTLAGDGRDVLSERARLLAAAVRGSLENSNPPAAKTK